MQEAGVRHGKAKSERDYGKEEACPGEHTQILGRRPVVKWPHKDSKRY